MIKFYVTSKILFYKDNILHASLTLSDHVEDVICKRKEDLPMTANQIDYAKNMEVKLHNRATEEQARNELAHQKDELAERIRHDLADEGNTVLKIQTEADTAKKNRINTKKIAKADRKAENKRAAKQRKMQKDIANKQNATNIQIAGITAEGRKGAAAISGQYNLQAKREQIDYDKWYATESPYAKKIGKDIDYADTQIEALKQDTINKKLDSMSQRSVNRSIKNLNNARTAKEEAETALKNKDIETYDLKMDKVKAETFKYVSEAEDLARRYGLDLYRARNEMVLKQAGVPRDSITALAAYFSSAIELSNSNWYVGVDKFKDSVSDKVKGGTNNGKSNNKSKSTNSKSKSSNSKSQGKTNQERKFKHK